MERSEVYPQERVKWLTKRLEEDAGYGSIFMLNVSGEKTAGDIRESQVTETVRQTKDCSLVAMLCLWNEKARSHSTLTIRSFICFWRFLWARLWEFIVIETLASSGCQYTGRWQAWNKIRVIRNASGMYWAGHLLYKHMWTVQDGGSNSHWVGNENIGEIFTFTQTWFIRLSFTLNLALF